MKGLILIGKAGSGKDTVADYLVKKYGFVRYAFADKIRDIVIDLFPDEVVKGKPRRLLQTIGTSMRQLDPDVWARYLVHRIEKEKPSLFVVSDCRYPNELKMLWELGALPVFIDCPYELRMQRLAVRDGVVNESLLSHESEQAVDELRKVVNLDDIVYLYNDGTLEELYQLVDWIVARELPPVSRRPSVSDRPSWHETFMEMARVASKRSTCLRKQVGAVLVKDNRVIATGYNGAPSGLSHCSDTGCVRLQKEVPSGQRYELCRSVHAEENCIIQAAVFGVSTAGSVLYCTHAPCILCARSIINARVSAVYYAEGELEELTAKLFRDAGVVIQRIGA